MVNKVLEEAAENVMPEPYAFVGIPDEYLSESVYSREQMLDIFKAGVEWREKQIPKLPDSLDNAADKYIRSLDGYPANQEEEMFTYNAFKAGAEWRDRQILKLPKEIEEAAEEYRRESCNSALKPSIDGPMPEYGGNVKAAFIAGAEWMAGQGVSMEVVTGVPWRAVDAFIHDHDYKEDSIIQIRKK